MVTYYKLDKVFNCNTFYTAESDKFYIIEKVGTNSTSEVTIEVDGVDSAIIHPDYAPLHKIGTNLLGLFDLKDLFVVLPPDKKLNVKGSSGAKVRLIGKIGILGPGEGFPSDLLTRYNEHLSLIHI